MKIQLIRSATVRIEVSDFCLLVDPWLAAKHEGISYSGNGCSPLVDLPLPVSSVISDIDAVFISHLHSDHFDQTAIDALPFDIPIITAEKNADDVKKLGFTSVQAVHDRIAIGDISLELTPGRHGPHRRPCRRGP